jgi:hypothetical protein
VIDAGKRSYCPDLLGIQGHHAVDIIPGNREIVRGPVSIEFLSLAPSRTGHADGKHEQIEH